MDIYAPLQIRIKLLIQMTVVIEDLCGVVILHGKDKESDCSYRTIYTCPFLAKALDKYVGSLYESG